MAVSGLADGDGGMQHMLIDSLRFALERSECLDGFWSNLDAGDDGTLGIANSARPFMVAARFSHKPQSTLAVVAGEDAAVSFARSLSAYLGEEKVLRFPERADYPFDKKHVRPCHRWLGAWRPRMRCRPDGRWSWSQARGRSLRTLAAGQC